MVQNDLLIWLDKNIDEQNNADCRNIINQLQRIVSRIKTFNKVDHAIDFLTDINNEKVFMIISGALCQYLVPLIHDVSVLDSIFIFCDNKNHHEQWVKKWSKIKGVFTEIKSVCRTLRVARQYAHNDMIISFMGTNRDAVSKRKLDELDCSFMYTQILKEILVTIHFDKQHIQEFTDFCLKLYDENDHQLANVRKFEQEYRNRTSIWWYSSPFFLYGMLNNALRLMDVDIIIKMGFFIHDLHCHIEQLHVEQFRGHQTGKIFIVYRGQGLSKTDFDQMVKTKDGLMSFNNFLSTSKDRDVSLMFAESNQSKPDFVGILFVMTIDPYILSTPFASVNNVSYFQDEEDEILFSMHTVFRIHEIKQMGENNRLWQVDLTLTSDNDQQLRELTEHVREETYPNSKGWHRLGSLLLQMGHPGKAQQVYEIALQPTTDGYEEATIYNQLGSTKKDQGEYTEALKFYEKSLEIGQKTLPAHHPNLATSYSNIGSMYGQMSEHSKALLSHKKALEIRQKSLPSDHPDLAGSYNNIGIVYYKMGEYAKALSSYEKALEIDKKSLPSNHPDLASDLNCIANVYDDMGEYVKALSFHEKALEIRQKSLPLTHPDLASSYDNIGLVHSNMGEYSKALSSHEKALEIRQKSLSSNHPDLASSYNNIGTVYTNMGEYSKALSSHEKALEIRKKSLSSNHPHLAASYNNIGLAYTSMGEYSKALSSHEKALEIRQKSLPSNHPDLAASYNNIGLAYTCMGEYSKALSSHEKALEIDKKSLPSNHPDLASDYNNIGLAYTSMGEHSKALLSHEKALEIRQKSLPSNHPDLAGSYNNIGVVYYKMGEYAKALSSYEKALEIDKKSVPSNHPRLAASYNKIGSMYYKMGEHSKALPFFECAVDIGQRSLPSIHPNLQQWRNNLDLVKKKL